ncbi:MAG: hypothetical protein WBB37_05265 [bacterium]
MKATVSILLLILSTSGFISTCKKQDDIVIYKVVPPPKPPFDAEKYNLVDTSKSFVELRTQAYGSKDIKERIQIFDYLLIYGPKGFGSNALSEFFKHFEPYGERHSDDSREMQLCHEAIKQDHYKEINEICINTLFRYHIFQNYYEGFLDSTIYYMDSLRNTYPNKVFFKQSDYDMLKTAAQEIKILSDKKSIKEHERLWLIGREYYKAAWPSFFHWAGNVQVVYRYLNDLINKYPDSPYVANAKYLLLDYEWTMATEDIWEPPMALVEANLFKNLLEQYPKSSIGDELLFRMAVCYSTYAYNKKIGNQDSVAFYYRMADSLYKSIDFEELMADPLDRYFERRMDFLKRNITEYRTIKND